MKFDCLIWYSKLALPTEDNDFVSNFLEQGLKIKHVVEPLRTNSGWGSSSYTLN